MVTLPLGLGLVAAAHRAVEAFSREVVGVSMRNIDDQVRAAPRFLLAQARPVVEAIRAASHAPIVLDGAGTSISPDAALRFLEADLGVAGEGEAVFPALLAPAARRFRSASNAGTPPCCGR